MTNTKNFSNPIIVSSVPDVEIRRGAKYLGCADDICKK